MYQGRTLIEMVNELSRQNETKRDFLVPTEKATLHVNRTETRKDGENTQIVRVPELEIPVNGHSERFEFTPNGHGQLADKVGIPKKYYDRMLTDSPDLLQVNVNHWLWGESQTRMFRTLDGRVRAVLSDRYRRIDNYDLLERSILPSLEAMSHASNQIKTASCEVTESRMFLKVLNKSMSAEIVEGDVVQAGISITNSEIGHSSVRIEPLVFRLVCSNGMIAQDHAMRKFHIGRQNSASDEERNWQYLQDDTRAAIDEAYWRQVRDLVKAALDETLFRSIVDKMREAAGIVIERPIAEVVELTQKRYGFTDSISAGIQGQLMLAGNTFSKYDLVNAVTRVSQEAESYENAHELEVAGGNLLSDSLSWIQ
jgi:hypothetical protein